MALSHRQSASVLVVSALPGGVRTVVVRAFIRNGDRVRDRRLLGGRFFFVSLPVRGRNNNGTAAAEGAAREWTTNVSETPECVRRRTVSQWCASDAGRQMTDDELTHTNRTRPPWLPVRTRHCGGGVYRVCRARVYRRGNDQRPRSRRQSHATRRSRKGNRAAKTYRNVRTVKNNVHVPVNHEADIVIAFRIVLPTNGNHLIFFPVIITKRVSSRQYVIRTTLSACSSVRRVRRACPGRSADETWKRNKCETNKDERKEEKIDFLISNSLQTLFSIRSIQSTTHYDFQNIRLRK